MRFAIRSTLLVLGITLVFACPTMADIATLTLSDVSSDETAASVLDARFKFKVTNPGAGGKLELTVYNDTSGADSYRIGAIYFNAVAANISGLTLNPPVAGWTLSEQESADGFGTFDYAVIDGTGASTDQISAGGSKKFIFDITGTGPFSTADFIFEQSTLPPGSIIGIVAAKFTGGPGDDSAFGTTLIPAPAAWVLALIGFPMVGWVRKRTARKADRR